MRQSRHPTLCAQDIPHQHRCPVSRTIWPPSVMSPPAIFRRWIPPSHLSKASHRRRSPRLGSSHPIAVHQIHSHRTKTSHHFAVPLSFSEHYRPPRPAHPDHHHLGNGSEWSTVPPSNGYYPRCCCASRCSTKTHSEIGESRPPFLLQDRLSRPVWDGRRRCRCRHPAPQSCGSARPPALLRSLSALRPPSFPCRGRGTTAADPIWLRWWAMRGTTPGNPVGDVLCSAAAAAGAVAPLRK